MVSLPSIGVLQVGGLGSSLKIVKSDSISTSKLVEIYCPNRVVNQQHFVERNLIVFCLKGIVALKKGRFWTSEKTFCLDNLDNVAGFQLKCWSNLSFMSLAVTKFQEFQVVGSCVSTLWSAYASTCLSQQSVLSVLKPINWCEKKEFHNGACGTWITWHESIDRISTGNVRAF